MKTPSRLAGGPDGAGASGRARVPVGRDRVDRGEDRVLRGDVAALGVAGRACQGAPAGADYGGGQRLKRREREVVELRRANEILKRASAYFAQAELDRRPR